MVTSVVKGKESFKAIILLTAQFRIHLTIYPCELHDYANIRNSANVDQLEFQQKHALLCKEYKTWLGQNLTPQLHNLI